MNSPGHPFWAVLRFALLMTAMCVTLWLTASDFDATEVRTIATMFLAAGATEGGVQLIRMFQGKK